MECLCSKCIELYEDTIAEITEHFVALLGFEDSSFGDVVFLEEHSADGLRSLCVDLEPSPVHGFKLTYNDFKFAT